MRPAVIAVVSIVAAVLGGTAALVAADATGVLDDDRGSIVVVTDDSTDQGSGSGARVVASPLPEGEFDPARIYRERSPGVVTIYARFGEGGTLEGTSQGSGFVVSDEGHILTNAHVITNAGEQAAADGKVEAADRVFVQFADHDRIRATIVGWDLYNDVGVLSVDPKAHPLEPVPLGDSARVVVGEPVAAIGSPFGQESSLVVGVVSATHRSIDSLTSRYSLVDAIQTDAAINQGNSGGPLFDARGRVVGINAQIRSESGRNEGVGFAVPVNTARRSMEQLLAQGRVEYAYVGITTDNVTPTLARRFGLEVRRGAIITDVIPGTAGARAGLRGGKREAEFNGGRVTLGGDLIVAINGRPVRSADDVVRIVTAGLRPGHTAIFTILRDGTRRSVRVTLGSRPTPSS